MVIYTKIGDHGETNLLGGKRVSKGDWLVNVIGQVDELNSHLGLAVGMMESILRIQNAEYRIQNNKKADVGLASLIGQLRDVQRELFEMGAALASQDNEIIKSQDRIISESQLQKELRAQETQRMAEEFVNEPKIQVQKFVGLQNQSNNIKQKVSDIKYQIFDARRLEQLIDEMEQDLPRLANFILPGGGVMGAQLMVCRSVCRRAERELVRYLSSRRKIKSEKIQFRAKKLESSVQPFDKAQGKISDVNGQLLTYLNRLSDYLFVISRWVNWLMEEEEVVWRRRLI
jgi:cob(I)alamin adenosyltransferase